MTLTRIANAIFLNGICAAVLSEDREAKRFYDAGLEFIEALMQ